MPNSAIESFADPWQFQASFKAARTLLTASGKYRAMLTRINLSRLSIHRVAISLPLVAQVVAPQGRTAVHFLVDGQQSPVWQNGVKLLPGVIALRPSGTEHYCRTSTRVAWGSMSLAPDDLAAAGIALVDHELVASPVTPLFRPPSHQMSRLLHLHEVAGRLAASAPDVLKHPEVYRAMEQELLHALVRCLAEGRVVVNNSSQHQRQPVMRRFERFLEENPDRSIHLLEMCAAIGVSERTLRLYCEEHVGMGPVRYLWLRRMNLARRRLSAADPTAATVTGIALDHGFGEPGRFSAQYRQLFGISPAETLRRSDGRPNDGTSVSL
jgi:AraC-like DNA-binding protein